MEFQEDLARDHRNLKKSLVVNSLRAAPVEAEENPDELLGPHNIIKVDAFLMDHMKTLQDHIKNPVYPMDIRRAYYNEYKVLELIGNLNKARGTRKQENAVIKLQSNSQLIITNNIIRDSFDMTSYLYILNWLQNIHNLELELSDKVPLKKHSLIKSANNLKGIGAKSFHFDSIEKCENLENFDKEEMTYYKHLTQHASKLIRSGRLIDAQEEMGYFGNV